MRSKRPQDDAPDRPISQKETGRVLRPALYISFVIAAIAAAFAYDLRTAGIFACSAAGYTADGYLAYCNSVGYGDYDHGALWFDLQPQTRVRAREADVLFLGSSQMQFAFSATATEERFAEDGSSFYLLGFSHTENIAFVRPLLEAISPRARAYVINVDRFFDDRETAPVAEIFHGDSPFRRYRRKRLWQYPHRWLCSAASILCGDNLGFFRSRANGLWTFQGNDALEPSGIADAAVTDEDRQPWSHSATLAEAFIAELPVTRDCVFLTIVPWAATRRAEAQAIADAVGLDLYAPRVEGLRTLDGSHLDDPSAELWSRRFFEVVGEEIAACARQPASSADVVPGALPRLGALLLEPAR